MPCVAGPHSTQTLGQAALEAVCTAVCTAVYRCVYRCVYHSVAQWGGVAVPASQPSHWSCHFLGTPAFAFGGGDGAASTINHRVVKPFDAPDRKMLQ